MSQMSPFIIFLVYENARSRRHAFSSPVPGAGEMDHWSCDCGGRISVLNIMCMLINLLPQSIVLLLSIIHSISVERYYSTTLRRVT
jgi:hypothetical protein